MHTLGDTHLKSALPSFLPVGSSTTQTKGAEFSGVLDFLVNAKVQLDSSADWPCKASVPLQANASAVQLSVSNQEVN